MTAKQKKQIIRLLCKQINAHVYGYAERMDKYLLMIEIELSIKQISKSIEKINYLARI